MRPKRIESQPLHRAEASEDIYKELSQSEIGLVKAIEITNRLEDYFNSNSLDWLAQNSLKVKESCENVLCFVGRLKSRFHISKSAEEAS